MKRILLVRTDRVGDVVFITPVIREIRKTFPDAFIATLTRPHTQKLMLNNPHLDATITDDLDKESFWRVVKELRKYKFTHGLLMMPTERAAYQMFLAGIKNRIGVGHKLYEVITGMKSVSRNKYIPLRHEADYCMDLARRIGVKTDNIKMEIFVTDEEKKDADIFLENAGVPINFKKIIVHSGSLGSAPNWSEKKYLSLLKGILAEKSLGNTKVLLTAREMSRDFVNKALSLDAQRIKNISDSTDDLRDLIKIISRADVFIGPSTGPLHIADALGVKSVGLFCHRPMDKIEHYGILNGVSLNLEISDHYCRNNCSADQNTCAFENGIDTETVLAGIKDLISNNIITEA